MDGECAHGEDGDKADDANEEDEYADGEDDDDEGEGGKTGLERKSYIDSQQFDISYDWRWRGSFSVN